MAYENLDNEALLDALRDERHKFTQSDKAVMRAMIDELTTRKVYPAETPPGNPNDVWTMVSGWGERWHLWTGPLECGHCKADLRNHVTGPPFKREIGHSDILKDRTTHYTCPDCKQKL